MLFIFSSSIIVAYGNSICISWNERIIAVGFDGLLAAVLDSIHSSLYVLALYHTYTINVFIMLSGVPLFVDCIFFFLHDEVLSPTTALLTIVYVIVVVYITYDGAIGSDGDIWY